MLIRLLLFHLIVVAFGSSELFSDEENAILPRLFHLDDYKRCLSQKNGEYCVGTFELSPLVHTAEYQLIQKYSSHPDAFNRTIINRGYCISSRCPPEPNSTLRFEKCVNKHAQLRSLSARLRTATCTSRSEKIARAKREPDSAQRLFLQVLYVILFFNFIGTAYDFFVEDGPNKIKLLSIWSVRNSWRRLTATYEDGDQRLKDLECIHGMRVISLLITMYCHTRFFHFQYYVSNPQFLEKLVTSFDGIVLVNGSSLIQMFVMLSSFLTAYNILLYSQKHKITLSVLPLLIYKRVVRILPVHIFLVGYSATWWEYARDGPLITSTIGHNSEICRRKFWAHVFFVNNIVNPKDLCLPPSWFFPVDMHMYILSCIMTIIMVKRRDLAIKLYTNLAVVSSILCGVIAYWFGWRPVICYSRPEQIRGLFENEDSFGYFYISSWSAIPACFIGLFMAHLHFELQEKKFDLSKLKWFSFIHNLILPSSILWVLLTGYLLRQFESPVINALYVIIDRPCFCLFMFMIMFGCFNVDGPYRRFFSWSGWKIFGRLSLPVMLCHWNINAVISARMEAYETSMLSFSVDYFSTGVFTFMISLLLSLFVEIPIQRFASLVLF